MKTDLTLDLPDSSVRVYSPHHLSNCIFLRFAPESRVSVEKLLRADEARELARMLLAAVEHTAQPCDVSEIERSAQHHRYQAELCEKQAERLKTQQSAA
jgi:hypothetical protein